MNALPKLDIHEDAHGWRLTLDGAIVCDDEHAVIVAAALKAAPTARRDNCGALYWPDNASAAHALVAARRAAGVMP